MDEVEEVCRSAAELNDTDPWEALSSWFERFIGYIATKQALVNELLNYLDRDARLFAVCRTSLFEAGEPLLIAMFLNDVAMSCRALGRTEEARAALERQLLTSLERRRDGVVGGGRD